eukprot:6978098-Prymnesium_polylepis.2
MLKLGSDPHPSTLHSAFMHLQRWTWSRTACCTAVVPPTLKPSPSTSRSLKSADGRARLSCIPLPGELSLRLVVQRDSVLAAAPDKHRHELHRLGKEVVRTISSSGTLLRWRGGLFSFIGFRSRVLAGLLLLVGGCSCHPIAVGGRQATLAVRGGADLGARGTLVSHPACVHIRRRAVLGRVVTLAHAQALERVFEPA